MSTVTVIGKYLVFEDKTIINIENEKIVFFGLDRFYKDIVSGDCCFMCGKSPAEKKFNDEHVLPKWLLRRMNLFEKKINFPNNSFLKYGSFTVPCCVDCNSFLSLEVETPISKLFNKNYDEFTEELKINPKAYFLLYIWVSLIFVKMHLKHKELRFHLDYRKPNFKISEIYSWENVHHIHCVARALYTNAVIDEKVIGSFLILPAMMYDEMENFDFCDNFDSPSILIRINEICIICILNDSQGSLSVYKNTLEEISSNLSPLQLREIYSRLIHINLNLKHKINFFSSINDNNDYAINVERPPMVEYEDTSKTKYGDIFYFYIKESLDNVKNSFQNSEIIIDKIKQGIYTFLYDENGNFMPPPSGISEVMPSLSFDIFQWDGRDINYLNNIYKKRHSELNFIKKLIQLCSNKDTKTAALWLIKNFVVKGNSLNDNDKKLLVETQQDLFKMESVVEEQLRNMKL